VDISTLTIMF